MAEPDAPDPRRSVPRTDTVLADPRLQDAARTLGRDLVRTAVASAQGRVRSGDLTPDRVVDAALEALPTRATTLRPVLNATGVVLHTNLGRAPLSAAAREALVAAAGTVDVELDLATGRRGPRAPGAREALLAAVPEAEDARVVNNGAAALVLATTALATGAEVVVSRGELVEIGDGFRLPDLITSCGARLREVGTTNRTHLADYAAAVGPDTGAVLKVHPSNFAVSGFTSAVPVADLVGLGTPVVHDIGSGLLRPHPLLPDEPDAATSLRDGARFRSDLALWRPEVAWRPQCREGHLFLGDAARAAKKWQAAAVHYERAASPVPGYVAYADPVAALYGLGATRLSQNRFAEARDAWAEAASLATAEGDKRKLLHNLATLSLNQGDPAEAERLLRPETERERPFAESLFVRARALRALGRDAEAAELHARLSQMSP